MFIAAMANLCRNLKKTNKHLAARFREHEEERDNRCGCCAPSNMVFSSKSLTSTVDKATIPTATLEPNTDKSLIGSNYLHQSLE